MSSFRRVHGPGLTVVCIACILGCGLLAYASGPQGSTFAGPAAVDGTSLILAREALAVAVVDPGDGTTPDWVAALPGGGLLVLTGEDGTLAAEDAPLACALAVLRDRGDRVLHVAFALPSGGIALLDPVAKEVEWRLVGLQAVALAAGDLDGDGIDDLVAVGREGGLFASMASGEEEALGDFDATAVATGHFLGTDAIQIAVSLRSGGLVVFDPLDASATALAGPVFTGLTAIDVEGDGTDEVIGQDTGGTLHAASIQRGEVVGLEPSIAAVESFDPFLEIQLIAGPPEPEFLRGNANLDNTVDLSDAVAILGDLFLGVSVPTNCRKALDANDSGEVDISDPITILGFLFLGGPAIPPPYPEPGPDPTLDSIPCES